MHGTNLRDSGNFRWELFKRKQAECENLPPTHASIHSHILRTNYHKKSGDSLVHYCCTMVSISTPTYKGLTTQDNYTRFPITSHLKPAPDAIELVYCRCSKSPRKI